MTTGYNPGDFLRTQVAERGDSIALRFPAKGYSKSNPTWDDLSFAQLDKRSDAYARGFVAQGIAAGDRTVLLMKPSIEFYCAFFGLMKMGAVPVLLDPGMGMKRLLTCIEENSPRVVLAMSLVHAIGTFVRKPFAKAEIFVTAGSRWWWGGPTLDACYVEADEPFELPRFDGDADMGIVFTSGSTGTPKGVSWSQKLFHRQITAVRELLEVVPGTTEVQCFASFAIHNISFGQTCVIPQMNLSKPATADPENIVAAIQAFDADTAFASPIVWVNVGQHCEGRIQLPSLKKAITTGAPIPVHVHRQFQAILPEGTEFWTPYGATESIPVAGISTNEILTETHELTTQGAGTCVGHPAPGIDIRIIPITDAPMDWSDDLPLPAGEIGEILVGGDQVSAEYKDKPAANREAKITIDGQIFHRMGDLGYIDEKGRLWFCGRKSHRLQTPTAMIPAVPVEGIFNDHPDVLRTALVGIGAFGEHTPMLAVQMLPGKTFDAASIAALAEGTRYEGLVSIDQIVELKDFPVDARHNSKIRRGDIKADLDKSHRRAA